MSDVYLDSPTNSTIFTTCCRVAILDRQTHCPRCCVEMQFQGARERWVRAYGKQKRGEQA